MLPANIFFDWLFALSRFIFYSYLKWSVIYYLACMAICAINLSIVDSRDRNPASSVILHRFIRNKIEVNYASALTIDMREG